MRLSDTNNRRAKQPQKEREMEFSSVPIEMPDGVNVIVGQSHFIKTVEDLHEALAGASPYLQFGIAFCEASGPCLVRRSGNADDLVEFAARNAEAIGAGHSFIIYLRDGYPVNVLNALKQVPEVCTIYCATANPVEVLIAQTDLGRSIIGVVDGMPPAGIETSSDEAHRKQLLREIGYKL
jgi:adenosine/AMP kinase